jgi:hypothetical protein
VKRFVSAAAVIFFSGATMVAAEQTWVGEISDSACGAHHESGAENVPAPPAKECVENCLRGGSTYVLVGPEHKVFQIANQTAAGLKENAGGKVKVTGELKGDSITVSKVEKAE